MNLIQEEPVKKIDDRKNNIRYFEPRYPYFLSAADKVDFVNGTNTVAHEIGDPESKKVELNYAGDHLYLSGNRGMSKILVKDGQFKPVYTNRNGSLG